MPKIAELKLSSCRLQKNCDCGIAELRLRSNISQKLQNCDCGSASFKLMNCDCGLKKMLRVPTSGHMAVDWRHVPEDVRHLCPDWFQPIQVGTLYNKTKDLSLCYFLFLYIHNWIYFFLCWLIVNPMTRLQMCGYFNSMWSQTSEFTTEILESQFCLTFLSAYLPTVTGW